MRKGAAILVVSICLVMILSGLAYASDPGNLGNKPEAGQLTLDQAVEKALANSKNLKQADYDIERGKIVRDQAADNVTFIPEGPSTVAADMAFTGLVMRDLAWQMSMKTKDMKADSVVLSVFKAYTDVLAAQEDTAAAESAFKTAEWQQQMARVSAQTGTLSMAAKVQAEASCELRKAALEASRKGLTNKYQALNNLIGYKPEDKPVLTDQPLFIPIKIDNLETEIQRRMELSPSSWLANQSVSLAKLDLQLYNWANPARDPYDAKVIDVTTAELKAADGQEKIRQGIRSIYNSILQLEDIYALQQQTLKIAEENLRVVRVQFAVGIATKSQILEAEDKVALSRKDIASTVYAHEVLKLSFDKPWASIAPSVASSAGASA